MVRLGLLVVGLLAASASRVGAQVPGPHSDGSTPVPVGMIEFVRESGVERWEVVLTGGRWTNERVNIRITGTGCTDMGEIYTGLIAPVYDGMDFRTANGRSCTIRAIER